MFLCNLLCIKLFSVVFYLCLMYLMIFKRSGVFVTR